MFTGTILTCSTSHEEEAWVSSYFSTGGLYEGMHENVDTVQNLP